MLLLFPLVSAEASPSDWVERDAISSAVELSQTMTEASAANLPIQTFLLAHDLTELGLSRVAAPLLRELSTRGPIRGAAALAFARAADRANDPAALARFARLVPWDEVHEDDRDELVFLVARACVRDDRLPEARDWAREIRPASPWKPYGSVLLTQIEFRLGRYPAAIRSAEVVFRHPFASTDLRERTAILLGDLLTEIGLFDEAEALLRWPSADGPFAGRARRDLELAQTLAALAEGKVELGARSARRVRADLESRTEEIDRVTSDELGRIRELERVWPPRAQRSAERRWAAERAEGALRRQHGALWQTFHAVWESLPPVALFRAIRTPRTAEPTVAKLPPEGRFFFVPSRPLGRALQALALLDAGTAEPCTARGVRERIVSALIGRQPEPTVGELVDLSMSCHKDRPAPPSREDALALATTELRAQANQRRQRLKKQRFALETALARAHLEIADPILEASP